MQTDIFDGKRLAKQLRLRVEEYESKRKEFCEVLDLLNVGVVVMDTRRRLILLNLRAKEIVASGAALTLRSGRLEASNESERAGLRGLVRSVLSDGATRAILLRGNDGRAKPPITLRASRLNDCARFTGARQLLAATIVEPGAGLPIPASVLGEFFGLTSRETALTNAILAGRVRDFGVSSNTAKTHLKRIFEKTECRSQGALLRLMATGPGRLRFDGARRD